MMINFNNQSENATDAAANLPKCTFVQACDNNQWPPFKIASSTCSAIDLQTTTGAGDR